MSTRILSSSLNTFHTKEQNTNDEGPSNPITVSKYTGTGRHDGKEQRRSSTHEAASDGEEPLSLLAKEGYGYYPCAVVGHRLNRYEIVRKLGWAGSSSVWLCIDTAAPHKTYVAIKMLTAFATACEVFGGLTEYTVFKHIELVAPHHPGFPHCLTMHDSFMAHTSAGRHLCFVTDVLGPNMRTLRSAQPNYRFSVSIAKRIIKQILLAINYLHVECQYIHTDIRSDNVSAVLADPVSTIDKHLEISPSQIAKSQPLTDPNLDLRFLNVRLIDYGTGKTVWPSSYARVYFDIASPVHDNEHDLCQAPIVRAPEVTLGICGQLLLTFGQLDVSIWSIVSARFHHNFSKHAASGLNTLMNMVNLNFN
ncbi:kinase-like domain-containing protein [Suillus placidus]|uniref:non-specific serine/threonine protein kinase n=1 Tax=Suillus placidus TaxID=48579 RepID=A0A9P7D730_9AGAM|nr:kinase-like domain-containing protein [Suillus placidus]